MTILLTLINHVYAIFYGIISSLLFLTFFYFFGKILLPRIFFAKIPSQNDSPILPTLYGIGIFNVICWYGIKCSLPLADLFKYLSFFALLMGVWKFKKVEKLMSVWEFIKNNKTPIQSFILVYSIFYFVAYISLPPSFSPKADLFRWLGNNDLLNYINISHYFERLGPSNVVGHSYILHNSYNQTPGTFYCFALFAVFYHGDMMLSAMPMLFLCMALIGFMIYRYCRLIFNLSLPISLSIGAVIIGGPFYHYIEGSYFLSTLISAPILIYLLTETARTDYSKNLMGVFYFSLASFLSIFSLYSILLFFSVMTQWGLMGLKNLFHYYPFSWNNIKRFVQTMLKATGILCFCLICICLLNPHKFIDYVYSLASYSNMTEGGWGLALISPFAALGIPLKKTVSSSLISQIITLLLFASLIIFCAISAIKLKKSNKLDDAGLTFFCFSVMTFVVYILYYYHLGPTRYQPWKFASYYPLPFCGAIWAVFSHGLQFKIKREWNWDKISLGLVALALLGNVFIEQYFPQPYELSLSNKYRRLAALEQMNVTDIWVKMSNFSSTFLPVYFIPHKKLHLLSESYYPIQKLDPTKISPKQPLFIETSKKCHGTSPDNVVEITHVGCLYFKMPNQQI